MDKPFENKKLKNYIDELAKGEWIGLAGQSVSNSSDNMVVRHIIEYYLYLKNSSFELDNLNSHLNKLGSEIKQKINFEDDVEKMNLRRDNFSEKRYSNSSLSGNLLIGYLGLKEDIGEIIETGTYILKLNEGEDQLGELFSLEPNKPEDFKRTSKYIFRESKILLFPHQYLAELGQKGSESFSKMHLDLLKLQGHI